jgi:hypothetical protein
VLRRYEKSSRNFCELGPRKSAQGRVQGLSGVRWHYIGNGLYYLTDGFEKSFGFRIEKVRILVFHTMRFGDMLNGFPIILRSAELDHRVAVDCHMQLRIDHAVVISYPTEMIQKSALFP